MILYANNDNIYINICDMYCTPYFAVIFSNFFTKCPKPNIQLVLSKGPEQTC